MFWATLRSNRSTADERKGQDEKIRGQSRRKKWGEKLKVKKRWEWRKVNKNREGTKRKGVTGDEKKKKKSELEPLVTFPICSMGFQQPLVFF